MHRISNKLEYPAQGDGWGGSHVDIASLVNHVMNQVALQNGHIGKTWGENVVTFHSRS